MSMKKTLVAVAILAVSGAAIAAPAQPVADKEAQVKNLKWNATLSPQIRDEGVIITDEFNREIKTGKDFELAAVNDTDLTVGFNYMKPAVLKFQAWEDTDTTTAGYNVGDDVVVIANANWQVDTFTYESRSASLPTTYDGEYVVRIAGKGTTPDDVTIVNGVITNPKTDQGGEVKVMVKADKVVDLGGTSLTLDPAGPVEFITAYVGLTATSLAP